jgi:hypothetical protein
MTRRFRPPLPLPVRCLSDGTPRAFTYRHRERRVTRIVSTWDAPAAWWVDEDPAQENPLLLARTYLRLIADDHLACEVFRADTGRWYLARIID